MKITPEQRQTITKRYIRFKREYNKIKKDNLENLAKEYGVSVSRIHSIIAKELILSATESGKK